MKCKIPPVVILLLSLILSSPLSSVGIETNDIPQETVPMYHWAYSVIDQLALRGYLHELQLQNRPYTRYQIYRAAVNASADKQDKTAGKLLNMLKDEFSIPVNRKFHAGFLLGGDIKAEDDKSDFRWQGISKLGYSFGTHITIYNGMRLDQNLQDDPEYTGKYWRGFSGYTEQAYILGNYRNFTLQFGRDYQVWGSGRSGHLLFSDNSQPFNLARLKIELGAFTFTSAAAQLDGYSVRADPDLPAGDPYYWDNIYHRRYFASHRIDWRITENLYAGVSEAVLYGGADRTFEWEYLNPFIFYHGEQQNYKSEGNTIICADFLWFPGKRWEIYGEVMIDDMQFDKKTLAEQEPAEIGWLFGFRKADPLGIDGMEIGIEHAAITPRTYNTLQPDQKFLHRNKPIAHPEGNDFILWMAEISKWVTPELQVKADFTFIRKGIDSISAVFDTSFYASDDYHESFPKGIVENRFQPGLELWYHLNHNWDFYFRGEYNFYDNYYHQEGKTEEKYLLRLGARLDLDWNFTAPKR